MNSKITRYLACFLLALTGVVSGNNKFKAECKETCYSCASRANCIPGVTVYKTEQIYPTPEAAELACKIHVTNPNSNGGSAATDTSPGFTPLNYKREGLLFEGVGPDYVKYETVNEIVNGVSTSVKKPVQLPTLHSTVFYSDLADGSGYQCSQYPNAQLSAPNVNGLRTILAGAQPGSITIYRNPLGTASSNIGTLDVIHKQRHPQSGVWVIRTIRKISPQGNNNWTTKFYLGDLSENPALSSYQEITITRTPHADGIESTREVTKDRDSFGSLVITSDVSVTYAFYKYGEPVKLSETKHTGTSSELTTTHTYFTDAGDQASFNKPATLRRSDGQWANTTYQGSTVTGILLTKTVSGWLDNAAPAIGTAPDEAANRVVVEIEAKNETGTFSREERIQSVLVSKTWGERYKENGGLLVEKSHVETGTTTLTTIRTGYSYDASVAEADRGRLKSIQNPEGTVEIYSNAFQGENYVVTADSGAGTLAAVTDGTRTVSTYTKDDTLIKEVISDVASGVVLSTREVIAFDANSQPSRWAYDNNPDDYSETLNGCCGIDSTRSRDGIVTTYTRDSLKRPKTAVSQGITYTYIYGSKSIGGIDFPTENVTVTAGGLTIDKGITVNDHAGDEIQKITPDLDGDGNPEITATTRNYSTRTTSTTNPDGGIIVESDFADGQSKSTTGTATAPSYHSYATHNEQGGGLVTATASSASGPWTKTFENLAGRTLKSVDDDSSTVIVLQATTYDNLGRPVATKDADNVTELLAYNAKGEAYRHAIDLNQNGQIDNADRVTDTLRDVVTNSPIGNALRSRSIIYDLSNNPVTVSTSYRSPGGFISHQETLGVSSPATSFRATHLDRADGSWTDTSTASDGTKQVTQYSNWSSLVSSRLDTANNVIESTATGHDALRRPVTQTHSRTGLVTTNYAPNGQVSSINDHGHVVSFGYDSMGRQISTTLPDNSVTHASYWPTGQEKATWGSQTTPTVKLYTTQGQLHKLRTFRNANLALAPDESTGSYDETTWTYNSRSQLQRKEYADGKGIDYTHTPAGRMHTRMWARGIVTTYGYNTAGELNTTDYSDTTPDVAIIHDKLGRQQSVTNGLATSNFTYDPTTLALDTETISYDINRDGTPELTRVLDRSRDTLGRDAGFQLKVGTTIENQATYGYSATDGLLSSVIGGGDVSSPQTFTYGYMPNSRLIHSVTGPAHTVINTWESNRDVLDRKENKVGTSMISSFDYTVNSLGQRTGVNTSGTAFPTLPIWAWSYDSLGQVISADSSVNTSDRVYQYDAIGNRKKSADSLTLPSADNYTANDLNQYSQITSSLSYDEDGSATSYPLPAAPATNSTLTWDAESRLISTTVGTSTKTTLYDAKSRRIAETTGGATILYVYDDWNCVAEYSISNNQYSISKSRLWGIDLSGTLQGAGGVGGLLSEVHHPQSTIYYPTYDGNGNVSEYLNVNGTVDVHYEYDAFGNTVVNTDTTGEFTYRFSTKSLDAATGLYYYGYRHYDPLTGRWLSRDPMEEEGGANLCGFVGNDGINQCDKFGLVAIVPADNCSTVGASVDLEVDADSHENRNSPTPVEYTFELAAEASFSVTVGGVGGSVKVSAKTSIKVSIPCKTKTTLKVKVKAVCEEQWLFPTFVPKPLFVKRWNFHYNGTATENTPL